MIKGYTYDEFGNLTQDANSFLNEITYGGSVTDTSSGLQYMDSRYYEPSTGRFLTQDSYSGNPYDPWTQHLYSYCGNNPTSMIDPTGHFWYYGNTQFSNDTSFEEGSTIIAEKEDKKVREILANALSPTTAVINRMADECEINYTNYNNNPSISNLVKWLTMSGVDWDRMTNNDKPLSFDHCMANINAAIWVGSWFLPAKAGGGGNGLKTGIAEGGVNTARVFTSSDPLVGDLANSIEKGFPGRVCGVNRVIKDLNGRIITDLDIELNNIIIQVKSGGGKGLSTQLQNTANATSKIVVGYGPSIKPSVIKGAQANGFSVFANVDDLFNFIKNYK